MISGRIAGRFSGFFRGFRPLPRGLPKTCRIGTVGLSVGFCPDRRSVVMERRRRAGPSPPGFSTLIALHNHGPGSRATQRPDASGQPSNPSRRGLAGLEPEPSSIESVLGGVMSLRLPLRGRPERRPRYGKSFPGSMSRKSRSRRDLRSPWSSLLSITTDLL